MDEVLLKYAVENGMIDLSYVQEQIEMNKRKELLGKHPYKIWEGKDGKWYTYLPDGEGRKLKKRTTQKAIEDEVIEYYSKEVKKQSKLNKEKEILDNRFDNNFVLWKNKQIAYGVSSNTISKYEYDYKRFFQGTEFEKVDIRNVTEEDITVFMVSRIKELNLKEKAGKALWGYLTGVFRSAKINKRILDDPCQYVDVKSFFRLYNRDMKPDESRILNDIEIEKLMEIIIMDHKKNPSYMPSYAVELSLYTGMRAGELAGLKWKNVLIRERVLLISESEKYDRINKVYFMSSTKTYKSRRFPISDEMLLFFQNLKSVQEVYGCYEGYVFSTNAGNVHCKTISDCIRNKCIQADIPVKGIHSVRRTVNSKMRCSGVPSTVAASLLGHTEEVNNTNYTYDITNMDYKMEIVEKINGSIKGNQGNQDDNEIKRTENLDKSMLSAL